MDGERTIATQEAQDGLPVGWQYWVSYVFALISLIAMALGAEAGLVRGAGVALFFGAFLTTLHGYRTRRRTVREFLLGGVVLYVASDWIMRTIYLLRSPRRRKG